MYHSLADGRFPDESYPKYTTTRSAFASHLQALKDEGFGFSAFATLGNQELPEKSCVLTFDDGHKSSLDLAEIMVAAGVRGTFFLTMNYCRERADFMKADEVRHLAAEGFHFGTHGVTHQALSEMPEQQMRAELRDSKHWLEDVLGAPVNTMSLPAGKGSASVRAAAEEIGYQLIGNSVERTNESISLPAEVNRFVVLNQHSASMVTRIARGSASYMLQRRVRAALLTLPKRLMRSYDRTRA